VHETLAFADEDGAEVVLDASEAASLLTLTEDLEAATVSACPECRSCVLAAVALVDLLESSPPHPRSAELLDLADEAPTLHLYVVDVVTDCRHRSWRDPGFGEWRDAVAELVEDAHRPH
jgi:hypothetical protein